MKATVGPLTAWRVEQEKKQEQIRDVVQRRGNAYVRMILGDVVQAWFKFVFVGSDSEEGKEQEK